MVTTMTPHPMPTPIAAVHMHLQLQTTPTGQLKSRDNDIHKLHMLSERTEDERRGGNGREGAIIRHDSGEDGNVSDGASMHDSGTSTAKHSAGKQATGDTKSTIRVVNQVNSSVKSDHSKTVAAQEKTTCSYDFIYKNKYDLRTAPHDTVTM